jgi:hypothetical protein
VDHVARYQVALLDSIARTVLAVATQAYHAGVAEKHIALFEQPLQRSGLAFRSMYSRLGYQKPHIEPLFRSDHLAVACLLLESRVAAEILSTLA